ncbi:zinc finger protein 271-like isoform X2 [Zootermopsis nevadensis]|uniref:zinc finger protein 271-like isoform X2 n=1 Tax=Zootermopsis nevadensis TaxID=136037 RepID=UPI000B8EA30D|nr:zinc finger protein 271-like isoform X2 [Zootermopsis nevadensis]
MDSVKDEPHSDNETCQDGNQVISVKAEDVSDMEIEEHYMAITFPVIKDKQESPQNEHELKHGGGHPNSCHVCSKSFHWPSGLKQRQSTHSGERLYTCNVCNKLFQQNNNLKIHKCVHSGECPYSCDMCNKSFAWKSCLKKHLFLHRYPVMCVTDHSVSGVIRRDIRACNMDSVHVSVCVYVH